MNRELARILLTQTKGSIFFFLEAWPHLSHVCDCESLTALSAAEQVAEHLREEILLRSFSGAMAGVCPLTAEQGVSHKTVKAALSMLQEGGRGVANRSRYTRINVGSKGTLDQGSWIMAQQNPHYLEPAIQCCKKANF